MNVATDRRARLGRRLIVLIPYAWLAAFFLVPFLIVFKISLSQTAVAQPPYIPTLDITGGLASLREFFDALSLRNYALLINDALYLSSYGRSIGIALISTYPPAVRALSLVNPFGAEFPIESTPSDKKP